jgi:hypothetical protein
VVVTLVRRVSNRISLTLLVALTTALIVATTGTAAGPTARRAGQISFYASVSAQIDGSVAPVVRPSVVYLTYDGAIVVKSLRWSSWGGTVARAVGVYSASDCNPSCTTGQRTNGQARIALSSPGRIVGRQVYRCFELTVPANGMDQRSCLKRQGTTYVYALVSKPTSSSALKVVRFYTPSRNIHCEMSDNGNSRSSVFCDMVKPPAIVGVLANGHTTINRGGSGNFGEGPAARMLPYGSSVTVGRFRCKSALAGVTCVVIKTGKGFFLSKQSIRALG